ncbi:hypothetical protein KKF91_01410 [Myxococcota bacterium]|nr:hypothetical protein [Myxococcota bacterium]MBU1429194.1 hypothetical protein [Myxococcota bacterium]MBU1899690.1 hypothetical protein [Myxococcota bacterium]
MGPVECVEIYTIAQTLKAQLDDPYSNAQRLGRLIDRARPLSELIKQQAEAHCGGRWQIQRASQAITILGFERLRGVLDRFIQERPLSQSSQPEPLRLRPRYVVVG